MAQENRLVKGELVQVDVFELELGEFTASTWLPANRCTGIHSGCSVGDSVQMGRLFRATAPTQQGAVELVFDEVEAAVIPSEDGLSPLVKSMLSTGHATIHKASK